MQIAALARRDRSTAIALCSGSVRQSQFVARPRSRFALALCGRASLSSGDRDFEAN
ncbi:MAG: hypothetical protein F6J93_38785 [Oscillatoria sp. SIO1A7]|nr:hypothetical protein [Oscillatoria sp. SIO1A7]